MSKDEDEREARIAAQVEAAYPWPEAPHPDADADHEALYFAAVDRVDAARRELEERLRGEQPG